MIANSNLITYRMVEVHVANSSATIEYKNSRLVVDTSFIGPYVFKINSLFQFIGELEATDVCYHSAIRLSSF